MADKEKELLTMVMQTVSTLEERILASESKASEMERKALALERQLKTLREEMALVRPKQAALERQVKGVEAKTTSSDGRWASIESKVESLEAVTSSLKDGNEMVERRVEVIEQTAAAAEEKAALAQTAANAMAAQRRTLERQLSELISSDFGSSLISFSTKLTSIQETLDALQSSVNGMGTTTVSQPISTDAQVTGYRLEGTTGFNSPYESSTTSQAADTGVNQAFEAATENTDVNGPTAADLDNLRIPPLAAGERFGPLGSAFESILGPMNDTRIRLLEMAVYHKIGSLFSPFETPSLLPTPSTWLTLHIRAKKSSFLEHQTHTSCEHGVQSKVHHRTAPQTSSSSPLWPWFCSNAIG
jgi:chemotaxis protein histidine kinase CheA